MELRSSSFSSWDDGADSYWKKDSSRDPEPAMKSTGPSDRWELQAGKQGASVIGPVDDTCVMRVLCSFRKWLWQLESRHEGQFPDSQSVGHGLPPG